MAEGHSHGGGAGRNERRVAIGACLTAGFMTAEIVGGLVSGSLALIADAVHMLTDTVALAFAWAAFRIARRPATWRHSYGFDRVQVLAAFVNGASLFLIAGWIVFEAAQRYGQPVPILAGPMLVIAILGLLVNMLVFYILTTGDRDNLNIRGAILHVMGDILGSVAAIVAALVILWTGWLPIDPILSVVVAILVLRSAWVVARDAVHILLEGAPANLEPEAIRADLIEAVEGVREVDHIHAWSISQERPMITLVAHLSDGAAAAQTVAAIKRRLQDRFGVGHATVEVDYGPTGG
ncbi:MAG: cation diffusion facilitator family transporter [Thalassobaculum sp.]|uniref:cation diffusion facilitator family transporter n=1 Tax=Thalassobaculum sp. TaxID=2022740 RepID=UPI0032ECA831